MVDTPRKVSNGSIDAIFRQLIFPLFLSALVHLVALLRILVPRYEGSAARRATSTPQSQHPGRRESGSVGEDERPGAGDGVGGRAHNCSLNGQRVPRPSFRH